MLHGQNYKLDAMKVFKALTSYEDMLLYLFPTVVDNRLLFVHVLAKKSCAQLRTCKPVCTIYLFVVCRDNGSALVRTDYMCKRPNQKAR